MASVPRSQVGTDDARIRSHGCEINVADHCNISCRGCSHLSPVSAESFADPEGVYRDLSRLAAHYVAHHVRLLGGEPLLHRGLVEVIAAVRASGISGRVRILTNGLLLPRQTEAFWEAV